jgi:hypothetical protein
MSGQTFDPSPEEKRILVTQRAVSMNEELIVFYKAEKVDEDSLFRVGSSIAQEMIDILTASNVALLSVLPPSGRGTE